MIEDNWIQYLQVDWENALKCQNAELMGNGESRLEQLIVTCQEIVNFSKR